MSTARFYHPQPLQVGDRVSLSEIAVHHLVHVLRARQGDVIILFNGEAAEYHAVIMSLHKKEVFVEISACEPRHVESPAAIHLGQVISKGDRMDWVLQKSVELGVNEITPLFSERCQLKLSPDRLENRMQHWQQVIIHASQQSGRTRLPLLHEPMQLADWCHGKNESINLLLDPKANEKIESVQSLNQRIVLLIGPEGGLTDAECEYARKQHFLGISLGPRILRTETAALTALTLIQGRWGDL